MLSDAELGLVTRPFISRQAVIEHRKANAMFYVGSEKENLDSFDSPLRL